MSAWGPAVFSDDSAADLRDDYRKLIGDGMSGPDATDHLIQSWGPQDDPGNAAVFWLALALTQWKCGRLEDRVKQRALEAIADGSALDPWRGGPSVAKRRAVLESAKKQLESPQPAVTRIAKRVLHTCPWEAGELVAYQMTGGDFVVFCILGHWTDAGGTYARCHLLDWRGDRLPVEGLPESTPVREFRKYGWGTRCTLLPIGQRKAAHRFTRLGVRHGFVEAPEIGSRILRMDQLDQQLDEYFDLR